MTLTNYDSNKTLRPAHIQYLSFSWSRGYMNLEMSLIVARIGTWIVPWIRLRTLCADRPHALGALADGEADHTAEADQIAA